MTAPHTGVLTGATALDMTLEAMHSQGYGPADVEAIGDRHGDRMTDWAGFAGLASRLEVVTHGLPTLFMTGMDPDLCIWLRDGTVMVVDTDTAEDGFILQWWTTIPSVSALARPGRGLTA